MRDDYDTPEDVAYRFLLPFRQTYTALFGEPKTVWEPAAGRGKLVTPLRSVFGSSRVVATTVEDGHDFLKDDPIALGEPWLICTNPPFSTAEAFARRALSLEGMGAVALLLRLGFLASVGRRDRLFRLMGGPSFLYVLSKRPSFTVNGRSDHEEYAWYVWLRGVTEAHIVLRPPGVSQYAGAGTTIVWL